ncbi:hypothetical protein RFI_09154 [Reticulomyxa filosa]|uniref:Uncharacterized protein n=1 Tax=Reticulomyxa filosa TaxID=46433 RepID=X6NQK9_RETFI|nr:hypothetical protein RFI_09154 [Reticulomyxa filosa]|eukprot:ETO27979.1 hypothetical protein RFI_09154 [Reticulomyxa filosa]
MQNLEFVNMEESSHAQESFVDDVAPREDRNYVINNDDEEKTVASLNDNSSNRHSKGESKQMPSPINVVTTKEKKRVIFISINSLNLSFAQIPEQVLESAIFCFAVRKAHLFPQTQQEKIASKSSLISKMNLSKNVLQWIRKKDEKKLSFLLLFYFLRKFIPSGFKKKKIGDHGQKKKVVWFDPSMTAWKEVSDHLHTIFDPATGENYKSLILDEQWWFTEYNQKDKNTRSKFSASAQDVVNEINDAKLKFVPSMEVLLESILYECIENCCLQ